MSNDAVLKAQAKLEIVRAINKARDESRLTDVEIIETLCTAVTSLAKQIGEQIPA